MSFSQPTYESHTFNSLTLHAETIADIEFIDCAFSDCNFSESVFQSCTFKDCIFTNCDLSLVHVDRSQFSGVTFKKSRCIGINWAVADWGMRNALKLAQPLTFKDCVLNFANFYGLTLEKMKLINCVAHEADFSEANLRDGDLSGTDLERSRFMHTNLENADFRGAKNYFISPADNTLTNAKFSLPEALNLLYSMDIEIEE